MMNCHPENVEDGPFIHIKLTKNTALLMRA